MLVTTKFVEYFLEICIMPFISEDCPVIAQEKRYDSNLRNTHKRVTSFSDKVSTRSSANSKSEIENHYPKNGGSFVNRNRFNSSIDSKNSRVAVYSPIVGVLRPRSVLRATNQPYHNRPKREENCIF